MTKRTLIAACAVSSLATLGLYLFALVGGGAR